MEDIENGSKAKSEEMLSDEQRVNPKASDQVNEQISDERQPEFSEKAVAVSFVNALFQKPERFGEITVSAERLTEIVEALPDKIPDNWRRVIYLSGDILENLDRETFGQPRKVLYNPRDRKLILGLLSGETEESQEILDSLPEDFFVIEPKLSDLSKEDREEVLLFGGKDEKRIAGMVEARSRTWVEGEDINKRIAGLLKNAYNKFLAERDDQLMSQFGINSADLKLAFRLREPIIFVQNVVSALNKYETELSERQSGEKSTELLQDDEIKTELSERERLLRYLGLIKEGSTSPTEHEVITFLALKLEDPNVDMYDPWRHADNAYSEFQVVYSALLLALNQTTGDFVRSFKQSLRNFEHINQNFERWGGNGGGTRRLVQRHLLANLFNQIFPSAVKGKQVFEVGGDSSLTGMELMGGTQLKPADAGHSGYFTLAYSTGSRTDMIELNNYSNFANPHSADIVVSSRLFDMGSGIGKIAEPANHSEDEDHLGEREMMLIMTNILKDGGFMIHYNSPIEEAEKGTGANFIYRTSFGADVYRFHQDKVDLPETFTIGKKQVRRNVETKTWERA